MEEAVPDDIAAVSQQDVMYLAEFLNNFDPMEGMFELFFFCFQVTPYKYSGIFVSHFLFLKKRFLLNYDSRRLMRL